MLDVLDTIGVVISITGTFIISIFGSRLDCRFLGFVLYLVSNIIMTYTFSQRGLTPYMFLQITFMVSSVIGIYRNKEAVFDVIKPRSKI